MTLSFCFHDWCWPQNGQQTCNKCGATRAALVDLAPRPRFDVPRYEPRAQETGDCDA